MADWKKDDIVDKPALAAMTAASVGARLKRIRGLLKNTIDQLSEKTGVARSYISDIENGKKLPPTKYLEKLIVNLNVSPTYIYLGTGTPFRDRSKIEDLLDHNEYTAKVLEMLKLMKEDERYLFFMLHKFTEYKEIVSSKGSRKDDL